jgi:hypothetical protein
MEYEMDISEARAQHLVALVVRYAEKGSRILEVGSREGDNLVSLWNAGFTNLLGLESSNEKVKAFKERHPDIAGRVAVTEGPIEEAVRGLQDAAFDLVFTVGFLFDKTGDYRWLFPELARVTGRYLIAMEDESSDAPTQGLERLGLKELESADLRQKKELESVFTMRVFERAP